jgi:hypothetical protein
MINAIDLTAVYSSLYRSVRVYFLANGEIEYVARCYVSDAELDLILNAGGAAVAGFEVELS